MASISELLDAVQRDPWREHGQFSEDLSTAQNMLFDPSVDPERVLLAWLQKYQPCLFGRIAAKAGLMRSCILRESDLTSDANVLNKIQMARTRWTADGFTGNASGFIVLLISKRLAEAVPDDNVFAIAQRLCSLYLREIQVERDKIHHDEIWLEKPGPERITWKWTAGVNYFCAQGDKRWWHDHRIPGGIAFSTNSIGHMARSGKIAEVMAELSKELGLEPDEFSRGPVRSLDDALVYSMLTINNASDSVSGKATELLPSQTDESRMSAPRCPVELPTRLAGKNHCIYAGWYHTDVTLPSEYFRPDVVRPNDVRRHTLDFTYLFSKDVENPDHETMGAGRRVRASKENDSEKGSEYIYKRQRMLPHEMRVEDCPRLVNALRCRKILG